MKDNLISINGRGGGESLLPSDISKIANGNGIDIVKIIIDASNDQVQVELAKEVLRLSGIVYPIAMPEGRTA